jgi:glycosyltransferase involved in cell wall biosynthesis
MTPTVSVVIPAYNAARTIGPTIASALVQTISDLEIVVVDDGSDDTTVTAARRWKDPRVAVISQANAGAAAARNTGIAAARGRYVALLDADDLWLPTKLERQLALLHQHAHASAVQTGAYFVDDDLRLMSVRECHPSDDALLDTLRFRNMPANMSAIMIERDKFAEIGDFDTSLEILEEWDMHIKCARWCGLQSVVEPLVLYRVHAGNRSRDLSIHIEPGLSILDRLFKDPTLPSSVRAREREIYGRFYTMLAGGAFKIRNWRACAHWARRALRKDPRTLAYMAAVPVRRLSRSSSRAAGPDTRLLVKAALDLCGSGAAYADGRSGDQAEDHAQL